MNKYIELRDKQSKRFNDLPIAFAFSNEQFAEAKKRLNVTDDSELCSIAGGGMMKKTEVHLLHKCTKLNFDEDTEAFKDDEFLQQMFMYELSNHEYCITGDVEDTLSACGMDVQQVEDDERLKTIFIDARDHYMATVQY